MTEEETMEAVKRVLVEEAQTDTVGLWAVLWEVKQCMPAVSPDEARIITLAAIRQALVEERVVAGQFIDHDEDTVLFLPWPQPPDETVARIEREWLALGREPNLGDVVWFVDPQLLPVMARKHPMGKGWKPS